MHFFNLYTLFSLHVLTFRIHKSDFLPRDISLKRKEEILPGSGKTLVEILDGDCHIREFTFLFEFQVSKLSGIYKDFLPQS